MVDFPLPDPRYQGRWSSLILGLILRALVNPLLALDLIRVGWAFRRRFWWRHAPFLPLPDRVYLRWRMETAYGHPDAVPPLAEVISFARWRRRSMGL